MNKVKTINLVFLITVIVSIVGSAILGLLPSENFNYFVLFLSSQILLVLPMALYIFHYKLDILETIRFKKISGSNIILLILFAYLIMPLMTLLNLISQLFATNVISDSVSEMVGNNPFLLTLFTIAFVPCIFEESVYRGVFYNEYRKVKPIKGIFLSAFLFGLMHMNFNQFSYAFAMGIIFCLLIEATDSILASMIVHFVINGTSVVISYLSTIFKDAMSSLEGKEKVLDSVVTKKELLAAIGCYTIIAIITTTLAIFVYKTIAKNSGRFDYIKSIFKKQNKEEFNETIGSYELAYSENKLISIPLVIGMLCCLTFMVLYELI